MCQVWCVKQHASTLPTARTSLLSVIRADWRANPGWSGRVVLVSHRLASASLRLPAPLRAATLPYRAAQQLFLQIGFGATIPANARLGPGVVVLHANGLGIHPLAEVASGVRLRHNVTIGVRRAGGTASEELPRIGVGADIGAGAFILGPIEIGAGAKIGAAAVVLDDVPPGGVAVGNPARVLPRRAP